jgi:hypothetical protein
MAADAPDRRPKPTREGRGNPGNTTCPQGRSVERPDVPMRRTCSFQNACTSSSGTDQSNEPVSSSRNPSSDMLAAEISLPTAHSVRSRLQSAAWRRHRQHHHRAVAEPAALRRAGRTLDRKRCATGGGGGHAEGRVGRAPASTLRERVPRAALDVGKFGPGHGGRAVPEPVGRLVARQPSRGCSAKSSRSRFACRSARAARACQRGVLDLSGRSSATRGSFPAVAAECGPRRGAGRRPGHAPRTIKVPPRTTETRIMSRNPGCSSVHPGGG